MAVGSRLNVMASPLALQRMTVLPLSLSDSSLISSTLAVSRDSLHAAA